jgi:hypothetical protein
VRPETHLPASTLLSNFALIAALALTERNTTKAIMSASEISKASTQTITSSFRPNIAVGCASEGLITPTRRRLASVSDVVIARMISITPT